MHKVSWTDKIRRLTFEVILIHMFQEDKMILAGYNMDYGIINTNGWSHMQISERRKTH